jgi:SAM-dependent methyltransferase
MSFSSPQAAPTPLGLVRYGLDQPTTTSPLAVAAGDVIDVTGWAFLDPPEPSPPVIALDVVNVETGAAANLPVERQARPDVAEHFGSPLVILCGFRTTIKIDDRFRGRYTVRVRVANDHGHPPIDLFTFEHAFAPQEYDPRRALADTFLRGRGLEVGALQRRLAVPAHCTVTYVDRMPLAELRQHYPELDGMPLQEPDLIDDGETLTTVATGSQDFLIANHFLEHCENPILTIENLARVLKAGGILFMAVPDKRFTFDIERSVTPYEELAATRRQGHRANRAALYEDWSAKVMKATGADLAVMTRKLLDEKYSIHFNVWTLPDLLEFLLRAKADFALPVTLAWVVCSDNEVIVILEKTASAHGSA